MWKFGVLLLFAVALVHGQIGKDLLLPDAVRVAGVVVDSEGKPIAKAQIDHSNDYTQAHETDADGRFELVTRAPVVVVRKQGYRSQAARTQDAKELRIALEGSGEGSSYPICPKNRSYAGIGVWATLHFPRVPHVKVSRQRADIDYVARDYYIKTESGPRGIRHGSGPMWGFGIPFNEDVWGSVEYLETTYDFNGVTIIDARGQHADGTRWRYLGMVGESAFYSGVDAKTSRILDQVLDGGCMEPASVR
ncbi:MAG: carboxypeptidase regulatory-like domain-containing protein [Bryobacterales bacterium]|nr:carboxypeptidase regulatory-like domain-containing protein [Bryobacterales bacterium]